MISNIAVDTKKSVIYFHTPLIASQGSCTLQTSIPFMKFDASCFCQGNKFAVMGADTICVEECCENECQVFYYMQNAFFPSIFLFAEVSLFPCN